MSPIHLRLVTVTLVLLLGLGTARADVVTDWNVTALGVSELALTPATARALAITHAAIFDAVNAVTRSHTPYLIQPQAPASTSQEAAASAAAYGVLVWLYPSQKARLDEALKTSLGKLPDTAEKDNGVAVAIWSRDSGLRCSIFGR